VNNCAFVGHGAKNISVVLTVFNSLKSRVTRWGLRLIVCCERSEFRKNNFEPTTHARGPSCLPAVAQMCGSLAHRDGVCSVGRTLHLLVLQFQVRCKFSASFMDHNLEVPDRFLGDFSQLKETKD